MAGQPTPGSNPWLTFDVTGVNFYEFGTPPPTLPPTTIVEEDDKFQTKVDFVFAGYLAPWVVGMGAECEVYVRYESLGAVGPGDEGSFGPGNITTVAGSLNYTATIDVPGGTLKPGTYKTAASVVVKNSPIAGYADGPIVQIIPKYP